MEQWQVLVFLVLALGVGLGSAAAAWATRPSKEERAAWDSWVHRSTPKMAYPVGTAVIGPPIEEPEREG